jgi:hypothetical protein
MKTSKKALAVILLVGVIALVGVWFVRSRNESRRSSEDRLRLLSQAMRAYDSGPDEFYVKDSKPGRAGHSAR